MSCESVKVWILPFVRPLLLPFPFPLLVTSKVSVLLTFPFPFPLPLGFLVLPVVGRSDEK